MLVKELIQMLKSNGIKGNSRVEIDCVDDVNINGYVIVNNNSADVVILTDDIDEVIKNYHDIGYEIIDYKFNGDNLSYREAIKLLGQAGEDQLD